MNIMLRFTILASLVITSSSHLPAADSDSFNRLSAAEEKAGWQLLFDGETTTGWRNYREDGIRDGWQVVDGTLSRQTTLATL